jgi:hypothetical protein
LSDASPGAFTDGDVAMFGSFLMLLYCADVAGASDLAAQRSQSADCGRARPPSNETNFTGTTNLKKRKGSNSAALGLLGVAWLTQMVLYPTTFT